MSIVLVSYTKYPADKGGVPLYNHYLSRIFPDCKWFCWADYPGGCSSVLEHVRARLLSKYLISEKLIKKGDIVIGDGVWGCYGFGEGYKLISVCHGLWECVVGKSDLSRIQAEGYARSNVVIATSYGCKKECKKLYQVRSSLLLTGLDLEFWKPISHSEKDTVLWVKKWKEHCDLNERARARLSECRHWVIDSYDDEHVRKLYSKSQVFVHLTTNEGNAFAILKSLACNTPVVSTRTGLFDPAPSLCGISVSPNVGDVVEAVRFVLNTLSMYHPRAWMKEYANLSRFGYQWKGITKNV